MKKVITYGTYDLLHEGHIRLLKRAKKLGDYLIVGVTSDDFDRRRGKLNVVQSLAERIEAVRKTGLADEIVVEEYEGQKIDDIQNYGVDIFAVGSDWTNKFDYLNEYCTVVYLPRTEGISSSELRDKEGHIQLGIISDFPFINKVIRESEFVNGVSLSGFAGDENLLSPESREKVQHYSSANELMENSDALYVYLKPDKQYEVVREALNRGLHVIAEAPLSLSVSKTEELYSLASAQKVCLMIGLRTAYSTAYNRLLLMLKSGVIGKPIQVQAVCMTTKNKKEIEEGRFSEVWSAVNGWAPTALLPVLQIYGCDFSSISIRLKELKNDPENGFDVFANLSLAYPSGLGECTVSVGYKGENTLTIIGESGYIYVPAPWWKTDYFEIRYENSEENKRCYYKLDGEGIRNELIEFKRMISEGNISHKLSPEIILTMTRVLEMVKEGNYVRIG